MAAGYVLAVTGATGAVGRTTTTIDLGAALAPWSLDVCIVDFDLSTEGVADALALHVEPPDNPTLEDVLDGTVPVEEATYQSPSRLDVLPSGVDADGETPLEATTVQRVLQRLRANYDAIVVDTQSGASRDTVLPLAVADEALLVSTPAESPLRGLEDVHRICRVVDTVVSGLVVTRTTGGQSAPTEHLSDVELLGRIPEDDAVPTARQIGLPVVIGAPDSEAASAYHDVARRIADDLAVRVPGTGGVVSPTGERQRVPERDDPERRPSTFSNTDETERATATSPESPADGSGLRERVRTALAVDDE